EIGEVRRRPRAQGCRQLVEQRHRRRAVAVQDVEVAPEVVAQNLPQASSRLVVREADLSALPLAAIAPELRVDRAQQVRRQAARPQAGALGFFADRLEDLGLVVEAAAGERQAQLREVPLRTDRADLQGGLEDVR